MANPTVFLSPIFTAGQLLVNAANSPLANGNIYVYLAGTTTPTSTYTDSTGGTANPNPIQLDSNGRVPNEIWLVQQTPVKFLVTDSSNNTIGYPIDSVYGTNDVPSSALVAGSDQNIQYNQEGTLTGSPDLAYDYENNVLKIGGGTPNTNVYSIGTGSTYFLLTGQPGGVVIQNSSGYICGILYASNTYTELYTYTGDLILESYAQETTFYANGAGLIGNTGTYGVLAYANNTMSAGMFMNLKGLPPAGTYPQLFIGAAGGVASGCLMGVSNNNLYVLGGLYNNGSSYVYTGTNGGCIASFGAAEFVVYTAPAGTPGTGATITDIFAVTAAGGVSFGGLTTTTATSANAQINASTGALARSTSSAKSKLNIQPLPLDFASKVLEFEPVTFKSNTQVNLHDDPNVTIIGLIAEQVCNVTPMLGGNDSVDYRAVGIMLLSVVKDQQKRIADLESRIVSLENRKG